MKAYKLLAATMLVTLTGCTTHLESGLAKADDPTSRMGIAYFLPVTQFDVEVTWTVTGCAKDGPVLNAAFKAKTESVPDPDALHVIDYASLNSWTKTSGVKVEFYDSGAIKSINASAEDKSGAIIGHVVSAAGKIGGAIALPVAGPTTDQETCSSSVQTALLGLDTLEDDIDRMTRELELAQEALDLLTTKLVQLKAGKGEKTYTAVQKQIDVVTEKKRALAEKQAELAGRMAVLSYKGKITFAATSDLAKSGAALIPASKWKKWLPETAGGVAISEDQLNLFAERKQKESAVYFELASVSGWQKGKDIESSEKSEKTQRQAGIRYRVAVAAKLVACVGNPCTLAPDQTGSPGKAVGSPMAVRILNRGTTFYLPFASKGFSNGALEARFAENGTLTYASYDQKVAAGEAIAEVVDDAADTAAGLIKGIRSNKKGELEKTKEETELVKAQQELALARAAQVRSPNADLEDRTAATNANTSYLEAQVAQANAELALRRAEAELAAASANAGGGQ